MLFDLSEMNKNSEMGVGTSLNMEKNTSLNLSKVSKTLNKIKVGLGWDIDESGQVFDLDASAFLLESNNKCPGVSHVIYFSNFNPPYGIVYSGDNRSGAGDGDDESIIFELNKIPANITKIVFTVSIFEAMKKKQSFGMVKNAYIRIAEIDEYTGQEYQRCIYNLTDDYGLCQSVIVGKLERVNGDWTFDTESQGIQGELDTLGRIFGV